MIDISTLVPRVEVFVGENLEDVVEEANHQLRYSTAVQITSTELTGTEDGQYILMVGVVYAGEGGE